MSFHGCERSIAVPECGCRTTTQPDPRRVDEFAAVGVERVSRPVHGACVAPTVGLTAGVADGLAKANGSRDRGVLHRALR